MERAWAAHSGRGDARSGTAASLGGLVALQQSVDRRYSRGTGGDLVAAAVRVKRCEGSAEQGCKRSASPDGKPSVGLVVVDLHFICGVSKRRSVSMKMNMPLFWASAFIVSKTWASWV